MLLVRLELGLWSRCGALAEAPNDTRRQACTIQYSPVPVFAFTDVSLTRNGRFMYFSVFSRTRPVPDYGCFAQAKQQESIKHCRTPPYPFLRLRTFRLHETIGLRTFPYSSVLFPYSSGPSLRVFRPGETTRIAFNGKKHFRTLPYFSVPVFAFRPSETTTLAGRAVNVLKI